MIDYKLVAIVIVSWFLLCLSGSLYEEYIVEGKISKRWFDRFGYWFLSLFR